MVSVDLSELDYDREGKVKWFVRTVCYCPSVGGAGNCTPK